MELAPRRVPGHWILARGFKYGQDGLWEFYHHQGIGCCLLIWSRECQHVQQRLQWFGRTGAQVHQAHGLVARSKGAAMRAAADRALAVEVGQVSQMHVRVRVA